MLVESGYLRIRGGYQMVLVEKTFAIQPIGSLSSYFSVVKFSKRYQEWDIVYRTTSPRDSAQIIKKHI